MILCIYPHCESGSLCNVQNKYHFWQVAASRISATVSETMLMALTSFNKPNVWNSGYTCLNPTKVRTSETWFECPVRSGTSTWILSWPVTPVKASGSPGIEMPVVWSKLSWRIGENSIFDTKIWNPHFLNTNVPCFFRRSVNCFFKIRQLGKDIAEQKHVPKPDPSKWHS